MSVWTPNKVSRRELDQRERYAASLEQMVDRFKNVLDDFNRELRRLYSGQNLDVELVFIPPTAETTPGVIPGRYHVLLKPHGGPPSVVPVTGPDGEFAEPDSGLFTWLAANDNFNPRSRRDREKLQSEADAARLRQQEREQEERQAELVDRWKARTRTQVSLNRDTAWGQNARGAAVQRANRRKP